MAKNELKSLVQPTEYGNMRESVYAASGFSLVSLWFQAEKGTLPPLECLSFANTIQTDLLT